MKALSLRAQRSNPVICTPLDCFAALAMTRGFQNGCELKILNRLLENGAPLRPFSKNCPRFIMPIVINKYYDTQKKSDIY